MNSKPIIFIVIFFTAISNFSFGQKAGAKTKAGYVLSPSSFKHYVDYFNTMEDENIVQAIPNAQSWEWMQKNIPLFECPQQNIQEIYYFRWWTLRKHIVQTPVGYAFTEFLVKRSYADKYNLIACAIGHHINEARWLHDEKYLDDYIHVWYRGNDGKPMSKLHGFSSWTASALYDRYKVNTNQAYLVDMLPDLKRDYTRWEEEKRLPNGLFWQTDVKDGMEETISGGRREKNMRPTINSYMYANAMAIADVSKLANDNVDASLYTRKADTLKKLITAKLWNEADQFFETRKEADTSSNVREAVGFIPWYFNMPDEQYTKAWQWLTDTDKFLAPFGLTTAERCDPGFRTHGCCKCEWDGAVWPFATSQTLTALANLLNNYKQDIVSPADYVKLLNTYTESQYYRGRPYIGEYLDEKTGYWLKGDEERSRYYNHSTYNDLIITGLVGLRPRADNVIEVNPLLPADKWAWFCLDNVKYHGKIITIIWDKDGTKYKRGKGLQLLVNGKHMASAATLQKITGKF
jgi:hypothetical protein